MAFYRKSKFSSSAAKAAPSAAAVVLLNAIEAEMEPWARPWSCVEFNSTSPRSWRNRLYHGSNVLQTMYSAFKADYCLKNGLTMADVSEDEAKTAEIFRHGFSHLDAIEFRFATFNGLTKELEAGLKKGSKATRIKFFKPKFKKDEAGEDTEKLDGFISCQFTVFPLSMAERLDPEKLPKPKEDKEAVPQVSLEELAHNKAKSFLENLKANSGIQLVFAGNKAFWVQESDHIQTPQIGQFNGEGAFWATLFHEIIHWTGAKSRLDRSEMGYAQEELIAELGSWEMCRLLKVEFSPQEKTSYLKAWLRRYQTRDEKLEALDVALNAADKAVNFLIRKGGIQINPDSDESLDQAA